MRIARQVVLTSEQRAKLETYARGRSTQARVVLRARLLAGARVFCMTVSRGWSTTLRDLAARLPSHRNSCVW
jgi:hypothetical protein